MKFTPTNRHNPCPICQDTSGDCRHLENDLILCHSFIDSDAGVDGWARRKTSKCGVWGVYSPVDGQAYDSERRERQQTEKRIREQRQRELRAKTALGADERDRAIRSLHNYIGLSSRHRQDLRNRGLSDQQIEQGLFFSITPDQRIPADIPHNLPGVHWSGKLATRYSGYACVAFDSQGRAIGWQLRNESEGAKYLWAKGAVSSHLANNELPITVSKPDTATRPGEIWLTEGILKPALASGRLGAVCLGAAGGYFSGSPEQAKAALSGYSEVVIAPDAGDIVNRHVMKRWRTQIEFFRSLGKTVRVAWWGQADKSLHDDIDEISPEIIEALAFLTPEEFLALGKLEQSQNRQISREDWDLRFKIPEILKKLYKGFKCRSKGFSSTRPSSTSTKPTERVRSYKDGDRLSAWNASPKQHLFDSSATGTGKSFDAGMVDPLSFEAARAIYITSDPRNPSTPTLKSWKLLEGRHDGLKRDQHGHLRHVKDSEKSEIDKNCNRVKTIQALGATGVRGANSSEVICKFCGFYEACKGGAVYGYLGKRREALEAERIIAHPNSLPNVEDFEVIRSSVLIWEEWSQILTNYRQLEAKIADIDKTIAVLATEAPAEFTKLQKFLSKLRQLFTGEIKQPNRFGWSYRQLAEQLTALIPDDLDLEALETILTPDLSFLNTTAEHGVDLADLPAGARKKFSERDRTTAEKAGEVIKQWLIPVLNILKGNGGYLSLNYGSLTITSSDDRLIKIARAAKKNIFLDATGSEEELAALLGVSVEEIDCVAQEEKPGAALKITQVTDLGRLGTQRGKEQERRVSILIEHLKKTRDRTKVIRFKKLAGSNDYRWFIESRGSNDLQDATTLILDGLPCPNLEQLRAEYTCIFGRVPDLEDDSLFEAFITRRIQSEIKQAIGRLRSSRRAGEFLEVIVLTDFPLDLPVDQVKASSITIEAASKQERWQIAIAEAVERLANEGAKITQAAIASLAGCTQQQVSKYREFLQRLLIGTYKASVVENPPPDLDDDIGWIATEYLAKCDPETLPTELAIVLEALPKNRWRRLFESLPYSVQVEALSLALGTLPLDKLRELIAR